MAYIITTLLTLGMLIALIICAREFIAYYHLHRELIIREVLTRVSIYYNLKTILSPTIALLKESLTDENKLSETLSCEGKPDNNTVEEDIKFYLSVLNLTLFGYYHEPAPSPDYFLLVEKEVKEILQNPLLHRYVFVHQSQYPDLVQALHQQKEIGSIRR